MSKMMKTTWAPMAFQDSLVGSPAFSKASWKLPYLQFFGQFCEGVSQNLSFYCSRQYSSAGFYCTCWGARVSCMNFLTDSLNMSWTGIKVPPLLSKSRNIQLHLFRGKNRAGAHVVHSLALHVRRPKNLFGAILEKSRFQNWIRWSVGGRIWDGMREPYGHLWIVWLLSRCGGGGQGPGGQGEGGAQGGSEGAEHAGDAVRGRLWKKREQR